MLVSAVFVGCILLKSMSKILHSYDCKILACVRHVPLIFERYLYHVTPAVTRGLGVCSFIRSAAHCVALYDRQIVWGVATYIIALHRGRHYMSVLGAHIVALKQYCRWDEIFTLHVLRAHIIIVSPH